MPAIHDESNNRDKHDHSDTNNGEHLAPLMIAASQEIQHVGVPSEAGTLGGVDGFGFSTAIVTDELIVGRKMALRSGVIGWYWHRTVTTYPQWISPHGVGSTATLTPLATPWPAARTAVGVWSTIAVRAASRATFETVL
jgi:hypothetical protein